MNRRRFLHAAVAAALVAPGAAFAFPTRTVTIVVPTAAGGGNDAMARLIAQRLTQSLGKAVIVENKPGGNGAIASEFVARAPADGHTILFGYTATHAINPALQKLRYDPVADFEPVGLVAESPTLMVAHPSLGVSKASDFVKLAKAKPGKLNYASAGNGTAPHLAAELFKLKTGTDMAHVPYKGSSPAMMDTIAGTTQLMFPSLFSAYPQVKSGKLVALGVAGDRRSPAMKDVPTLAEQGIADVNVSQWYALFAPAKTPKDVVKRLNAELNRALGDKDVVAKMEAQGADVETSTPEALGARVVAELGRWKKIIAATGVHAD